MNTKSLLKSLLISASVSLIVTLSGVASAQGTDSPVPVLEAVAPVFPVIAIATAQQGKVQVDVRINEDGTVRSVDFGQGPSIFRPLLKIVAGRWRFASTEKNSGYRTVRLSFVFTLVPSETKSEELLPIYRPPYEVEVKGRFPIITKDAKRTRRKHSQKAKHPSVAKYAKVTKRP